MSKRVTVQETAEALGLGASTWSPGDGMTRYRFHASPEVADYFGDHDPLATLVGRREALAWIEGYKAGRRA